jgi:hypothetical protein
MTRNIYKLSERTLYHERTGEPYTMWYVSCTFPSGKWFGSQSENKAFAIAQLRAQLVAVRHSADLALKYLEKKGGKP